MFSNYPVPISDETYMQTVAIETGCQDGEGNVIYPVPNGLIPTWYSIAKGQRKNSYLAYLYTKLAILRYFLGLAKRLKDITIGLNSVKASQAFTNAMNELKEWTAFIQSKDPNYSEPAYMRAIQPGYTGLDVVEEAMKFAWFIDPYLDERTDFFYWAPY